MNLFNGYRGGPLTRFKKRTRTIRIRKKTKQIEPRTNCVEMPQTARQSLLCLHMANILLIKKGIARFTCVIPLKKKSAVKLILHRYPKINFSHPWQ